MQVGLGVSLIEVNILIMVLLNLVNSGLDSVQRKLWTIIKSVINQPAKFFFSVFRYGLDQVIEILISINSWRHKFLHIKLIVVVKHVKLLGLGSFGVEKIVNKLMFH